MEYAQLYILQKDTYHFQSKNIRNNAIYSCQQHQVHFANDNQKQIYVFHHEVSAFHK
ncbi:hypothetical protein BDF20DRAFT_842567 [Mycotypha africana]|uniref:uncharacterized protein n=1 Tax=Mycotypha africana TaxID=64632 RepID=UPI002300F6B0|nr:uncharacterized protein BDF20DRAFT_842567 [Mycotypha africana]KAI8991085.1 hypothetical protein BDF20DRAFT_842567 [Mycotypha africana]